MTIEEAERFASWIQRAFPYMQMEPKLYVRALVHYDGEIAQTAILKAITNEWKMLPKVAEVVEVLKSSSPPPQTRACETCSGDRLVETGEGYALCPACHPLRS